MCCRDDEIAALSSDLKAERDRNDVLVAWQKAAAEERIRLREAGNKMRVILRMKPRPSDEEVDAALAWDRANGK